MESVGKYILSITSAALLYSILHSLTDKKSSTAALLQLIGGLFLTFTVITPLADIDFAHLFDSEWNFSDQGNIVVIEGEQLAQEQRNNIIKQRCEAYILDKAMSYQTPLHVKVSLSQGDIVIPSMVTLEGNVSPYIKSTMQQWLQEEMGIPKENQIWSD